MTQIYHLGSWLSQLSINRSELPSLYLFSCFASIQRTYKIPWRQHDDCLIYRSCNLICFAVFLSATKESRRVESTCRQRPAGGEICFLSSFNKNQIRHSLRSTASDSRWHLTIKLRVYRADMRQRWLLLAWSYWAFVSVLLQTHDSW